MNKSLIQVGRTVAGVGLSFALALSTTPTNALAASSSQIQAELDAANAHLSELASQSDAKFTELETVQADLQDTRQQIGDLEDQIQVKEGELVVAREALSRTMSDGYKGHTDVISFVLSSSSFDEIISRVYYANKVANHQSDAIATVREIQRDLDSQHAMLEEKETEQEELLGQAQSSYEEIQSLQASQETYVNQLSGEVQEAIAAERAAAEAEARRQQEAAAAEAARQAAEAAEAAEANGGDASEAQGESGNASAPQSQDNGGGNADYSDHGNSGGGSDSGNSGGSSDYSEPSYDDGGSSSSDDSWSYDDDDSSSGGGSSYVPDFGSGVWAAIEYAQSQIGVSYSYGGNAIANQEFDCSGLVWWAYNQAGYSIPRGQRMSNGRGNSMVGWCLDNGGWTTDQSNLQAGDLMFWGSDVNNTTHVAMCIGGGLMIHSNYGGVEVASVYYGSGSFVGGGPII